MFHEREIRATGYGEAVSADGYGYMRYVDCNSALALLGFILFVDILRDIVEYVTTGRRRRRWAPSGGAWAGGRPEAGLLDFIAGGGVERLQQRLPGIVVPLLEGWWELSDPEEPRGCLQQSVCQANAVLARDYGGAGRVIATLISNVGSRVFSGSDPLAMRGTLDAARTGRRRREACEVAFPSCPGLRPRHQQQRYSNATWPLESTPLRAGKKEKERKGGKKKKKTEEEWVLNALYE
ncbi:uncharacterized protein LOC119580064 [Penaeus monodon]|uniref:uncharacterized protein LOC119580064 n=1 Tax=Penaeus monodon TaxID=6687 RepID=UPI0018A769FA|nr:uncharacterized protein LOC119580064 [Penaeus monodon]